jgi:hypothetical protein
MRSPIALLVCLGLGGCGLGLGGEAGGPPLVSAQYPPGTGPVNGKSEPQPLGSLPAGAANISSGPGGYQPNYLSWTFGAR